MNPVWLRQAAQLDPRSPDIQHSLGLTLRLYDDVPGALAAFRRAVELEPDRAISLLNIGQTYAVAAQWKEARRWLDSALHFNPDPAFYRANLGYVLLQLGDTAGARAEAAEAARRGGRIAAENILALIDVRAGDTASARARLKPAQAELESRDCQASHDCLELAFTLAAVGERSAALGIVDRLRGTGPWLAYWLTRPEFNLLQNESRYQSALAQSRAERDRLIRNP